ncbi:hypothetical protein ACJX0J_004221 [Zea mays]
MSTYFISKLLQVASVGQSTLTRFYSLHTFVVTCHLDTSLQLRSIFIQISLYTPILLAKLAKGMGHNYYGEPAWPNDLLYIFPVVILGTIAGTSFPYFKYSVFFSLGIFRIPKIYFIYDPFRENIDYAKDAKLLSFFFLF